jgi:hypothetical protein
VRTISFLICFKFQQVAKEQPSKLIPAPKEESNSDEAKEAQIAADLASLKEQQDAEMAERRRKAIRRGSNLVQINNRSLRSERTLVRPNRKLKSSKATARPIKPPLIKTYSAQSFRR